LGILHWKLRQIEVRGMAIAGEAKEWLIGRFKGTVAFDEPMTRHTSFRVGGPADAYIEPETVEELAAIVEWAGERGIPYLVIGAGTNLLVRDKGFRGMVLNLSRCLNRIEPKDRSMDSIRVDAMAGVKLQRLCRYAIAKGLEGLSFALGIPGTVGGAVMMNAGTSKGSMQDVLDAVECLWPDGRIEAIERKDLAYSYRTLSFERAAACGSPVILGGCFRLRSADPAALKQEAKTILDARKKREPRFPNAGCFFKNPNPETPAGRLIEQAGFKGERIGDAEVSQRHANYIINRGDASAAEILELANRIRHTVLARFGIDLKTEVRIVGEA
jgi:UDP-N-acetylmuramate dehydrogenase